MPSPLVPSRPRSKTPDSRPSTGHGNAFAWQGGVSTSTSGSSTCMFHLHPSLPNPKLTYLVRICRWSRAITHEVTSPRTPLPHAPTTIIHTPPSCPHLLRYRLHPIRADSRRSDDPRTRACRHTCTTRNGTSHPSELAARPAFAEAALDRRRRTYRFTAELLYR